MYARTSILHCPECRSSVFRVARRPWDRLLSLFVPVSRYRCARATCTWQGLARRRADRPRLVSASAGCIVDKGTDA